VITVDTPAQKDSVGDTPANCTLGDAIESVNLLVPMDGCTFSPVSNTLDFEIILPPGSGPYILSNADNSLFFHRTGLPVVSSTMTIVGNGNTIQRDLTYPCTGDILPEFPEFGIFLVAQPGPLLFPADLTLTDLTIKNGCANGGAIAAKTLGNPPIFVRLIRCDLDGNGAPQGGGGAVNIDFSTLVATETTFANNTARSDGGAIKIRGGGATITDSVLFNNTANGDGGAIGNAFGFLTIERTTIAGNSVGRLSGQGGGIANNFSPGDVIVSNSTLSGNSAGFEQRRCQRRRCDH
jgi:hypothetical protein